MFQTGQRRRRGLFGRKKSKKGPFDPSSSSDCDVDEMEIVEEIDDEDRDDDDDDGNEASDFDDEQTIHTRVDASESFVEMTIDEEAGHDDDNESLVTYDDDDDEADIESEIEHMSIVRVRSQFRETLTSTLERLSPTRMLQKRRHRRSGGMGTRRHRFQQQRSDVESRDDVEAYDDEDDDASDSGNEEEEEREDASSYTGGGHEGDDEESRLLAKQRQSPMRMLAKPFMRGRTSRRDAEPDESVLTDEEGFGQQPRMQDGGTSSSNLLARTSSKRQPFVAALFRRKKRQDDHDAETRDGASSSDEEDEVITIQDDFGQAEAEALGRDLEEMGYDLDCQSFITKDSALTNREERYKTPIDLSAKDEKYFIDPAFRRKERYHIDEGSECESLIEVITNADSQDTNLKSIHEKYGLAATASRNTAPATTDSASTGNVKLTLSHSTSTPVRIQRIASKTKSKKRESKSKERDRKSRGNEKYKHEHQFRSPVVVGSQFVHREERRSRPLPDKKPRNRHHKERQHKDKVSKPRESHKAREQHPELPKGNAESNVTSVPPSTTTTTETKDQTLQQTVPEWSKEQMSMAQLMQNVSFPMLSFPTFSLNPKHQNRAAPVEQIVVGNNEAPDANDRDRSSAVQVAAETSSPPVLHDDLSQVTGPLSPNTDGAQRLIPRPVKTAVADPPSSNQFQSYDEEPVPIPNAINMNGTVQVPQVFPNGEQRPLELQPTSTVDSMSYGGGESEVWGPFEAPPRYHHDDNESSKGQDEMPPPPSAEEAANARTPMSWFRPSYSKKHADHRYGGDPRNYLADENQRSALRTRGRGNFGQEVSKKQVSFEQDEMEPEHEFIRIHSLTQPDEEYDDATEELPIERPEPEKSKKPSRVKEQEKEKGTKNSKPEPLRPSRVRRSSDDEKDETPKATKNQKKSTQTKAEEKTDVPIVEIRGAQRRTGDGDSKVSELSDHSRMLKRGKKNKKKKAHKNEDRKKPDQQQPLDESALRSLWVKQLQQLGKYSYKENQQGSYEGPEQPNTRGRSRSRERDENDKTRSQLRTRSKSNTKKAKEEGEAKETRQERPVKTVQQNEIPAEISTRRPDEASNKVSLPSKPPDEKSFKESVISGKSCFSTPKECIEIQNIDSKRRKGVMQFFLKKKDPQNVKVSFEVTPPRPRRSKLGSKPANPSNHVPQHDQKPEIAKMEPSAAQKHVSTKGSQAHQEEHQPKAVVTSPISSPKPPRKKSEAQCPLVPVLIDSQKTLDQSEAVEVNIPQGFPTPKGLSSYIFVPTDKNAPDLTLIGQMMKHMNQTPQSILPSSTLTTKDESSLPSAADVPGLWGLNSLFGGLFENKDNSIGNAQPANSALNSPAIKESPKELLPPAKSEPTPSSDPALPTGHGTAPVEIPKTSRSSSTTKSGPDQEKSNAKPVDPASASYVLNRGLTSTKAYQTISPKIERSRSGKVTGKITSTTIGSPDPFKRFTSSPSHSRQSTFESAHDFLSTSPSPLARVRSSNMGGMNRRVAAAAAASDGVLMMKKHDSTLPFGQNQNQQQQQKQKHQSRPRTISRTRSSPRGLVAIESDDEEDSVRPKLPVELPMPPPPTEQQQQQQQQHQQQSQKVQQPKQPHHQNDHQSTIPTITGQTQNTMTGQTTLGIGPLGYDGSSLTTHPTMAQMKNQLAALKVNPEQTMVSDVPTNMSNEDVTWAVSVGKKTLAKYTDDMSAADEVAEALIILKKHAARLGVPEAELLKALNEEDDESIRSMTFAEEIMDMINIVLGGHPKKAK